MSGRLWDALRARGWRVELRDPGSPLLTAQLAARYSWLPEEVVHLLAQLETCRSADDTAWLLTAADFHREPGGEGFRWDQYERMAVEAADGDESAIRTIREFWSRHFPFALAVHSDYDYLAIREGDGAVVHGFAPYWEAPDVVASSFAEFLETFAGQAAGEATFPLRLFLGRDA
jgi:hypothetical protein